MSYRETAHRWFVEYNPLYFASAGCVFAGVFLVSQGLSPDHFASKAGVVGITEFYVGLLIAGAWLLLRMGQRRPAALLGILAFLFSIDIAFNGERLFSHARTMSLEPGMRLRVALPASLLFAALGPVKLILLAKVFRLRGIRPFLALAGSVIFLLPLLPYVVEAAPAAGVLRSSAHLSVSWLGAPLLGWALLRGAWRTEEADGERVRRVARVVPFLLAAVFAAHALTWSTYAGLGLTFAHAAPFILLISFFGAIRLRGFPCEISAWLGMLVAVAGATEAPDGAGRWAAGAVALMAGGAALALAWRYRLPLLLPGISAGFGGACLLASDASVAGPAWLVPFAVVLLAGSAVLRDLRCLLASAAAVVSMGHGSALLPQATVLAALGVAVAGWLIFPRWRAWLPAGAVALALAALTQTAWSPNTPMSWGLLLLLLGFVFLVSGVAVNLRGTRSIAAEGGTLPGPEPVVDPGPGSFRDAGD